MADQPDAQAAYAAGYKDGFAHGRAEVARPVEAPAAPSRFRQPPQTGDAAKTVRAWSWYLMKAVLGLLILFLLGAIILGAIGYAVTDASKAPADVARPSDWQPPSSRSRHVVRAFLEIQHGSYTATLTKPATVWRTVADAEQAQKFAVSHPGAASLPAPLEHAIACHLPQGAHVVAAPWQGSRYEEVMTPDGPEGYCDGVVRLRAQR